MKNLDSLFPYHPAPIINIEFKQQIGHAVGEWYDEFRRSKFGNDISMDKKERDYPFAVLYPVVVMLTFPQEEFLVDLDSPIKSKSEPEVVEKQYIPYQDLKLPRWGGSYNNISQRNTCSLDNVLAILSIFKGNITQSFSVIGTSPTEAKFHPLMSLISDYDFDQLRNLIATEIGLQTTRENFSEIYDFHGSEGTLIIYLKIINLCNDKYISTFHCHLCEKNFNWGCMIGSIGCIITNLEYSICAKLLAARCQHCQTTITDNFKSTQDAKPSL